MGSFPETVGNHGRSQEGRATPAKEMNMSKESRSKTTDPVLREKRINAAIKANQTRKAAKEAKGGRLTWAEFSALYACEEFHSLVEAYRQAEYDYRKAQEEEDEPEDMSMTDLAEAEEDTALELARLVSHGVLPHGGRAW
jgi:hypothetical protein